MSNRSTKKLRQLMRREYAKDIHDIAKINSSFIKPKPKYVPLFIWLKLLSIFIKIK